MSGSPRPCEDLDSGHGLVYARRYLTGWKCDRHTPSAWRGRPEPPSGPGWPAGSYLSDRNPNTNLPVLPVEEPPS
ncbi:hypothetical protein AB0L68_36395 [Streptomyces sp. NPDC052164]|uniref:hypothetical protein n=1 Tax=Streptomyces sp. NPDC052164 TaxID=3155529 RepID=UPI00342C9D5E